MLKSTDSVRSSPVVRLTAGSLDSPLTSPAPSGPQARGADAPGRSTFAPAKVPAVAPKPAANAAPSVQLKLAPQPAPEVPADVLFLPVFHGEVGEGPAVSAVDRALEGILLRESVREGFAGNPGQMFKLSTHGKLPSANVVLVGLGSKSDFDAEALRNAAGEAAKLSARIGARAVAFDVPRPELAQAASEGFALGNYSFDRYRTGAKKNAPKAPATLSVLVPPNLDAEATGALERRLVRAREVAEATNWARDLVNEPGQVMTPTRMADEAVAMAKEVGLHVSVGGQEKLDALGMGMFSAVTRGSVEEPRLIELRYEPENLADARRQPLALVGKGVTFDAGGISIKPAAGMEAMKGDMAGAAAVLGAMRAVAQLKPPFPVHAYIGACENLPDGKAFKPGDILTSFSGKTVEITNTDAEGRLILGDLLTYACSKERKPKAIVDLATLTGACIVALGNHVAGAFGNDDRFTRQILEAGAKAGEALWELPIHPLQGNAMRSSVADLKNSGERSAGAINAAHFLRHFVGDGKGNVPAWVHLDIAGPAQSAGERGYMRPGGTGFGVRTLLEWVRREAEQVRAED